MFFALQRFVRLRPGEGQRSAVARHSLPTWRHHARDERVRRRLVAGAQGGTGRRARRRPRHHSQQEAVSSCRSFEIIFFILHSINVDVTWLCLCCVSVEKKERARLRKITFGGKGPDGKVRIKNILPTFALTHLQIFFATMRFRGVYVQCNECCDHDV